MKEFTAQAIAYGVFLSQVAAELFERTVIFYQKMNRKTNRLPDKRNNDRDIVIPSHMYDMIDAIGKMINGRDILPKYRVPEEHVSDIYNALVHLCSLQTDEGWTGM